MNGRAKAPPVSMAASWRQQHLKRFMLDQIDASAEIGTDRWGGYKGLKSEFPKLVRGKSEKKGQNIPAAPQDYHDDQGLA